MEKENIEKDQHQPVGEDRALDTEAIKAKWEEFSSKYSHYMARDGLQIGIQMYNIIGGNKAHDILEVGCGDGILASQLGALKNPQTRYVGADLTENMSNMTLHRLEMLAELFKAGFKPGDLSKVQDGIDLNSFQHKLKLPLVDKDNKNGKHSVAVTSLKVDYLNAEVHIADNENLSRVAPVDTFNGIISSLSLHIVTNPDKMLSEGIKVLKPGGKAIFTVWGSKENSYTMNLVSKTFTHFEIEKPAIRDLWHLNDRNKLINLVETAGFKNVQCWSSSVQNGSLKQKKK